MNEIKHNWKKWVYWFILALAITFYKLLDNFSQISNIVSNFFNVISPFFIGVLIAYLLYIPSRKIEGWYRKTKIKILNKKFSTIITDKDFYKYGLLTQIIQTLIKNGYTQTIFDNFNLILSSSLTDETFDILLLIKSIPNSNQLFFNNIEEIPKDSR